MAQALAKKFEYTGPAQLETVASGPQSELLAIAPEHPLPKEPSHQSKWQDRAIKASHDGREPRLREKEKLPE